MAKIVGISSRKNRAASVSIPGESGKKMVVIADVGVGPIYQRGKEGEDVPVREGRENAPWAVFGCGLKSVPGALFSFLLSFLFFFSDFI
jgi:hypothetical protein